MTKLPPIRGVPKANDLGQLKERESKNFIRNNRMDSMDRVTKKTERRRSYDHTQNKNYGKVPNYLNKFKEQKEEKIR